MLVEAKANIDIEDGDGSTALMYAARYGYIEIVKELIDNDANVNLTSKGDKTEIDLTNKEEIEKIFQQYQSSKAQQQGSTSLGEADVSNITPNVAVDNTRNL
ncbi:ankyrin repeat domain-containing protein [Candidatus Mesenet endosymbiont of Phosphuga atrata]|uniref:ankyrin repeat domain-containing protein n=1 Tax=Candidatus Mesenet endosymbiont of Phosphuga atrata TaxID=3066221 RepID=UPI0030CD4EFA